MAGPVIRKRRIVGYTSGVFDLFHVGHLRILRRAKALCDRLIVGVTVDELVGYKNQKVVVPFEQRMEIVSGLKAVDLAIPQDDLDKFVIWKKLKFDVLFIGDDWYDSDRFRHFERKLKSVGVKIIYLPYTAGISTTGLKSTLRLPGKNAGTQGAVVSAPWVLQGGACSKLTLSPLSPIPSKGAEYKSVASRSRLQGGVASANGSKLGTAAPRSLSQLRADRKKRKT